MVALTLFMLRIIFRIKKSIFVHRKDRVLNLFSDSSQNLDMFTVFLFISVACVGSQEDGGHGGCVPGFQVKHYQVAYSGPFQKGQVLVQGVLPHKQRTAYTYRVISRNDRPVEFDDCAGNADVKFEVSDPDFHVDRALKLVPLRDVPYSRPVLFIHGLSAHADDTAQVEVTGLPAQSPHTLRDILSVGQKLPYRSKRSLLVPPMIVTENQRAPFPRIIGRVISAEKSGNHIFRLTGPGADQDPKGLFTIDIETGDVSVSRSLDREAIESYQRKEKEKLEERGVFTETCDVQRQDGLESQIDTLKVGPGSMVTDRDRRTKEEEDRGLEVSTIDFAGNLVEEPAMLLITVIDQNDNRPIFKETRYTGELENSLSNTLAEVCQELRGESSTFQLPEEEESLLSLLYQWNNDLKPVMKLRFPLEVQRAAAQLPIEPGVVMNLNFYQLHTILADTWKKLYATSCTGTTVMTMTAFDADDPATDNAALRYSIVRQSPDKPSSKMFNIDEERGDIVTAISPVLLDRETLPTTTYELEIVAKDMAGSEVGLTGTATATITITDKNDHAPEFTHPLFEAYVYEGSTGVVVNLTVDDRDDPDTGAWRATYYILNGDPTQSFEIQTNPDNNEGMLSVVKPLDYEANAVHTLLIQVENEDPLVPDVGYGPSSTATVHVTVQDINEGPIFFPDPLTVTRMENIPVGSSVASLNATDPDTLQKQSIRYAVLRDPAGWLSVNPVRGTVNTSASLDRESPYVHDNKYTAVFIATDNGSPPATGTGTLVIHLEDYNDNAPYVVPSVAQVCEDTHDMNVAIVGGRDKDLPPNGAPFKIELGKQPGLDKTWKVTRVNSTHSQIMLLHSLKKANYQLPLLITDSGVPPLSNNTEIKVQVCVCKKNRMHCSSAHSHRASLLVLLATLLLALI
ncbi:hypothetical protein L3Q82_007353 [Scortum barcoo]|uniref:Uncharacterized protein n=1 Tax=Scortum barcoo TaxID=214431 RepID=A0ACB8WS18_9TELE|nr:hypothetical protein L3Q82_007353 [Scortum barcoo]